MDEVIVLDAEPQCPACDCPEAVLLGKLGFLVWLRCRGCGVDYPTREADADNEEV